MDYELFKVEICKMSGIDLSLYKEKQMKRRIDALIRKNGHTEYNTYVKALQVNKELYNEFINYLTINVSEFYRNPGQWQVLEHEIFPLLLQKSKSIRIWSAACSTGEEPYTLVMVLSKLIPLSNIHIFATDIDKEVLRKASIGLYTAKSLEFLPKELLNKYFTQQGEMYKVNDEVKRCVEFKHHNLLRDEYPQNMDLIVCRNVLIYFTEEAKDGIYKRFNKSLKKDGILFVGSTEQIIYSQKYALKPTKTFFYTKENDII